MTGRILLLFVLLAGLFECSRSQLFGFDPSVLQLVSLIMKKTPLNDDGRIGTPYDSTAQDVASVMPPVTVNQNYHNHLPFSEPHLPFSEPHLDPHFEIKGSQPSTVETSNSAIKALLLDNQKQRDMNAELLQLLKLAITQKGMLTLPSKK